MRRKHSNTQLAITQNHLATLGSFWGKVIQSKHEVQVIFQVDIGNLVAVYIHKEGVQRWLCRCTLYKRGSREIHLQKT